MNTIIRILSYFKQKIRENPSLALCVILLLLGCTIYLCLRNIYLSSQLKKLESTPIPELTINTNNGEKKQTTELVAVKDSFKETPKYSTTVLPGRITYYDTETVLPSTVTEKSDTASDNSFYFRDFVEPSNKTFSTRSDSLVQILLDRKKLTLSSYNQGYNKYITKEFDVDYTRYRYNWTPEGLSSEKVMYFAIQPYLYGKYQPFHREVNLGTGISFKTRKLDYNLGVSLNNSGWAKPQLKSDLELTVIYKFDEWLK